MYLDDSTLATTATSYSCQVLQSCQHELHTIMPCATLPAGAALVHAHIVQQAG